MENLSQFISNEDNCYILPQDIIEGEVFRVREDLNNDPNAVFVEFSKPISLEKLLKIKGSSPAEKFYNFIQRNIGYFLYFLIRLSYTRHLGELITNLGNEGANNLKKILENLIDEADEIKLSLLSQITLLKNFLIKRNEGYSEIINYLLPTLAELLSSDNLEIKEKAGEEVSNISSILSEEDRGKYILTTVLGMAHNDISENDRIVAVQLLSKMSTFFGKDLCEQFVGLEILSLGEDPQTKVRRETIIHLPTISKVVSPLFFRQRFFPFYLNLANDTASIVRKACVDIIVNIAEMSEPKVRETTLTNLILKFLKDSNKWVKISGYKQLGPFINSLSNHEISDKLLENYCQMAFEELSSVNELAISCAFNFPAVLQAVGVVKWPILLNTFQTLLSKDPEVKKPLACSLHEIARIIGPENSLKDLSFVFETFLTDTNDELKQGVLKNLCQFLEVVGFAQKQSFIDIFLQVQKEYKSWRIRETIADQLDCLAEIYNKEVVFRILAPISLKLCEDSVFTVRKKAAKKFARIFLKFTSFEDQNILNFLKDAIINFRRSSRYNMRQIFIIVITGILEEPVIFKLNFLKEFKSLVFDKCINVRISLSKSLLKHYKHKGKMRNDGDLLEMLNFLKNDEIKDVREIIDKIKEISEKMELEEMPIFEKIVTIKENGFYNESL